MRGRSPSRPTARRREVRGFTLVELLVTLVISSVIVSAAVSGIVALNEQTILVKRRAELETEAKLLTEVLVSQLQGVGGGSLRPWSVINVRNNQGPYQSDEIILAELDSSLNECAIVARPGAGNVFRLGNDEDGNCCMSDPAAWEGRVLMAVNGNGAIVRVLESNNANGANCQINFVPNAGAGLDKLPGDDSEFVGGSLLAVQIRRYFVDAATKELVLEMDTNNDGTPERHVLADRVYDLQVALGYDTNQDRAVFSNGTAADEYLYNHPADVFGTGGLLDARDTQLRTVQVGLIMGVPFQGRNTQAKSLDGPVRSATGTLLRATHGRAFMRNLSLYDQ